MQPSKSNAICQAQWLGHASVFVLYTSPTKASAAPTSFPDSLRSQPERAYFHQPGRVSGLHALPSSTDRICIKCQSAAAAPERLQSAFNKHAVAGFSGPVFCGSMVYACRTMTSLYGRGWRQPDLSNHGPRPVQPDEESIRQALVQKLSLTAWGTVPYHTRWQRCLKQPANMQPHNTAGTSLHSGQ